MNPSGIPVDSVSETGSVSRSFSFPRTSPLSPGHQFPAAARGRPVRGRDHRRQSPAGGGGTLEDIAATDPGPPTNTCRTALAPEVLPTDAVIVSTVRERLTRVSSTLRHVCRSWTPWRIYSLSPRGVVQEGAPVGEVVFDRVTTVLGPLRYRGCHHVRTICWRGTCRRSGSSNPDRSKYPA